MHCSAGSSLGWQLELFWGGPPKKSPFGSLPENGKDFHNLRDESQHLKTISYIWARNSASCAPNLERNSHSVLLTQTLPVFISIVLLKKEYIYNKWLP